MDNDLFLGTIALDAMGSDLGPAEVVEGLKISFEENQDTEPIILVGPEHVLRAELKRVGLDQDPRIQIQHASQVINMDEKPIAALKRGKDSSMVRAIELVKEGKAKAVISCGNTGSLMAGGTIKLRPLEGIERPALACVMPHRSGHFVLCDVGANPESKPQHLVHNAILASHYAQVILNIRSPRIGLLTIGTEEGKGNERIHDTHDHLKKLKDLGMINYQGPIEGFQIFENHVDVVICDGFVGNIVLKSIEGLFRFLKDTVTTELKKDLIRQAGALLSMGAFRDMKAKLNPERYSGARLLGLRGHVFKAHGSTNRHGVAGAIRNALDVAHHDMTDIIRDEIEKANQVMKPSDYSDSPKESAS